MALTDQPPIDRPALDALLLFGEWEDRGWTEQAQCTGHGELFFDPLKETPTQRRRREAVARTICANCPVMFECRDSARRHREHGFWGGENEEERTLAGYMPKSSGRRTVLNARRRMQDSAASERATG
jgi:WhiB family transcriptional regulator, redox-sensing transcriptional regulator